MPDVSGKKLMILGGNRETGFLVEEANLMGVHTIVVDPNAQAPAKRFAAEHYEIDGFDVPGIVHLAQQLDVDGVLVGVADVLVRPYMQVCEQLDLPCYATKTAVAAFGGKDGFKDACARFGVPDIPGVLIEGGGALQALRDVPLPAMIKPVDNGGGVGMQVCYNADDMERCVKSALQDSKSARLLIERYMDCDDMFAYYTFRDGHAYLSATADRITTRQQGGSPVCVAAMYPSRHTDEFIEQVHPKLLEMFEGVAVVNGVLSIQFFVEQGSFFAYDPGFRLQGEAPHIHLKAINGFDHRQMLVQFALTGSMGNDDFAEINDVLLHGRVAATFWVLLRSGKISSIDGLATISQDPHVIAVLQRLEVGDRIAPEMVGTERQVMARIYVVADSRGQLADKAQELRAALRVADEEGSDMVLDWVPQEALK